MASLMITMTDVFYGIGDFSQMILLHGFIKKTQQTPNSDIDLAIKRLKEWKHEHKTQIQ